MKTLYIALTFAAALLTASVASAQAPYSVQESGDIFADLVRLNSSNSSSSLVSPFNIGFVNTPTSPMMNAVFQPFNQGSPSNPDYDADLLIGTEYNSNTSSYSAIYINFSSSVNEGAPAQAVTMVSNDYIPCIETKIPKGTYTFQSTATPFGDGSSTAGTFMFETCTAGIWTVQFNLALPKPEGATRTLTFAHDTRVRWMIIRPANGQGSGATITAKYYNSGS